MFDDEITEDEPVRFADFNAFLMRHRITKQSLADKMGNTRSYISLITRGKKRITRTLARNLRYTLIEDFKLTPEEVDKFLRILLGKEDL